MFQANTLTVRWPATATATADMLPALTKGPKLVLVSQSQVLL